MPHRCAWETAHTDHIERRPRGRIPIVGAATGARRPTGVTHCIVLISHRGLGRSKCNHTAFLLLLLAGNPRGQRPACARSTRRAAEKRRQGERGERKRAETQKAQGRPCSACTRTRLIGRRQAEILISFAACSQCRLLQEVFCQSLYKRLLIGDARAQLVELWRVLHDAVCDLVEGTKGSSHVMGMGMVMFMVVLMVQLCHGQLC